jgi:ubiquinone/menaquinone biosynthesis C-methylase UbiE
MDIIEIKKLTKMHYNSKIKEFGPCYKGVDWGSNTGQQKRFEIICKKIKIENIASIIDYGCGYGEFLTFIKNRGFRGYYQGYDISNEMIKEAQIKFKKNFKKCIFTSKYSMLKPSEYCMASGVFNIKLMAKERDWIKYIEYNLEKMNRISKKGFFFNMFEKKKNSKNLYKDVYFINSEKIKNYCEKKFSKYVDLERNYYLNDFTIFVNKKK